MIFAIDYGKVNIIVNLKMFKKRAYKYFENRNKKITITIRGIMYLLTAISALLILFVNSGLSLAIQYFSTLSIQQLI